MKRWKSFPKSPVIAQPSGSLGNNFNKYNGVVGEEKEMKRKIGKNKAPLRQRC